MTDPPQQIVVPDEAAGARLDAFLAKQFPEHSRVRLRRAITDGGVQIDGHGAKPSMRLRPGQRIDVRLPPRAPTGPAPEPIPVDVLFEDEHLAAVNKPPGMVVHPARGHWQGTLASALAHHFGQLSSVGGPSRPGIVHRLDRDTSGVLVVAKSDVAHYALSAQFERRTTEKRYLAIVVGTPDRDRDMIDEPIGHHPHQREKMAIRRQDPAAREARTFFELQERFDRHSLLSIRLLTGRTHQIRVHLAHAGMPVLCDRLYGGRASITAAELAAQPADAEAGQAGEQWALTRQALHAQRLTIEHPVSKQRLEFAAPLPDDLRRALEILRGGSVR